MGQGNEYYTEQGEEFHTEQEVYEADASIEPYHAVQKRNRRNILLLVLLVVVFGIPLATSIIGAGFSIVTGLLGAVFGGLAGLIGLVISVGAVSVVTIAGGVGMITVGCCSMANPAIGVMLIGGGFLLIGLGLLAAAATGWGCKTVIPGLLRFCADIAGKVCQAVRKLVKNLRGKGGRMV